MRGLMATLISAIVLTLPLAARADQNDVAFDQLQRVYILGAEPPPIDSFDDLQKSFNTLGPSVTYPPLPGTIGGIARQREGVLYHYSFLGGLKRVDDPSSFKATIGRPDKVEVDYLDLRAKTYSVVTGDSAKALLEPNLMGQMRRAMNLPSSSSVRGSLAMSYKTTSTDLPARAFDGLSANGVLSKVDVTSVATGTCPAVTANVAVTAYVDASRTEPFIPASGFNMGDVTKAMTSLGCTISINGAPPSPNPALAHFITYERIDSAFTIPQLPMPIQTSTVVQRAHVAPLGPADASLFEVPAGFTRSDAPQPLLAPSAAPSK